MHKVNVKGILSAKNGMNIYRGCLHGCIYCDSRSLCYQMNHKFEDIEVKANAVELLENALRRKRNKCMIGTGAMSDPYMPIEEKLGNMRKCLEVIERYGFGVTMITKSTKVLRDLDLLKKINEKSKCVVQMTLTTYDEDLCRIVEPNVETTYERFRALEILRDNGIPTVVWLCPILPFINDTEENIRGLLILIWVLRCVTVIESISIKNSMNIFRDLKKNISECTETAISFHLRTADNLI